jgi:hypothetical protein
LLRGPRFAHLAASPCEQGEYQGDEFSDPDAPFDLRLSRSTFFDRTRIDASKNRAEQGDFSSVYVLFASEIASRQLFHRRR